MRNLQEHPITEQEVVAGLRELAAELMKQEICGDIRPLLLHWAAERVQRSPTSAPSAERRTYEPLTREKIEGIRSQIWQTANGDHQLRCEFRKDAEALCDMAVNSLLYAEEIHRLRDAAPSSVRLGYVESSTAFNNWWDQQLEGWMIAPKPEFREWAWRAWSAALVEVSMRTATLPVVVESATERNSIIEECAEACMRRALVCGHRALPKHVGEACATSIRALKNPTDRRAPG